MQFATGGGVEASLWEFPLNLILLLFIFSAAATLRWGYPASGIYKYLRNAGFSAGVLSVGIILTLISGLFMQDAALTDEYGSTALSAILHATVNSWPFVCILILLMLILCTIMMGRKVQFSLRYFSFQLNHAGLFLLMAAALFGAADKKEYRIMVGEGRPTSLAYSKNGVAAKLPFEVQLDGFDTEYFPNKLTVLEFDTLNGNVLRQSFSDLLAHTYIYKVDGYDIEIGSGEIYSDSLAVNIMGNQWLLNVDYGLGFAPLETNKALILSKGGVRRYMASLSITDLASGHEQKNAVMVNHPWAYGDSHIYLENYVPHQGVVLRISTDHWLWMAYAGLWAMIAGALLMFISGPVGFKYNRENPEDGVSTFNIGEL